MKTQKSSGTSARPTKGFEVFSRSPGRSLVATLVAFTLTLTFLMMGQGALAQTDGPPVTGTVDSGGRAWAFHDVTAPSDGTLAVVLDWVSEDANLSLYARRLDDATANPVGPLLTRSKSGAQPEQASFEAEGNQKYRLYVFADSGTSDYTLTTNLTVDPNRRHLGTVEKSGQVNRFHDFTLTEGSLVAADLSWAGDANLDLFLREADGTLLDVQRSNSNPERTTVHLPAGDYQWLVTAAAGSAAYQINSEIRSTGALVDGSELHYTRTLGATFPGGVTKNAAWQDVDVDEDGILSITLAPTSDSESADLQLFVHTVNDDGALGPVVASSRTSAPTEQLSLDVPGGDTYRIVSRVPSGTGPSGYDLKASLSSETTFLGTSDAAGSNFRSFPVTITESGLVTGVLRWADGADLTLHLRNPDGELVAFSATNANPEVVAFEAESVGEYTFAVFSRGGASSFALSIDQQTGAGRSYPGHVGYETDRGATQNLSYHDYTPEQDGLMTIKLVAEDDTDLNLDVREVTDPDAPNNGPLLATSRTSLDTEQLSVDVTGGSVYRVYVTSSDGPTHYQASVDLQTDPLARSYSGTAEASGQQFRAYPLTLESSGELTADLTWAGEAELGLYVLDGDEVVAQAPAGDGASSLTWTAPEAGSYELVVEATAGATQFVLDTVFTPGEPVAGCAPISTLTCGEVVQEPPVELAFDGTDGGLVDKDGDEIGFTMVDPPSARLDLDGAPSNPEVPGYEPGLLEITEDGLTVEATRGIQYQTNATSTNTNSLINGLGVGVAATDQVTTVTTTIVAPDFDASANSEKGGLWFGLDEDNLVNLVVQNQSGTNVRAQMQREIGGVASGPTNEINGPAFAEGQDVVLTMVLDHETNTATGSYQVGTAAAVELGEFTVPQAFFDGEQLPDEETGPASYAGVFTTKRLETTNPLFLTFGDFAVTAEEVPGGDNTAPEVLLTGDRTLFEGQDTIIPVGTFDEDDDAVAVTVEGLPSGLAYDEGAIAGALGQDTAPDSPYTVTVVGDDGTDTTEETFAVTVVEDISVDVNFQSPTAPTPSGYLADSGLSYGARGNDQAYGWVEQGTSTPLNMSANGRDRNRAGVDQLLDTFVHMQYGDLATVYGGNANCTTNQCKPGAWEIAVPNGLYEVTVGVGDQPSAGVYDSLHALNLESGVLLEEFQATSAKEYLEATAQAGVQDGKLTINAIGGANTKINYVRIRSLGTQPVVTTNIPANRAQDVALDTSISASVVVPGSGIGVDPNRSTSLTDAAVKLFEVTDAGDVEVAGNRGSTGGNDTIAFSPLTPLKADATYRYVIDGVLDGAGNTFGKFTTLFATRAASDPGPNPDPEGFSPVEDVDFEKVLLPTASGADNGKYFASLQVHDGHLWATTIGQGMLRYEVLPDGTLGPEQDLGVFAGRASIGLVFDENDPDLAWVTHATANLGNESARIGSKLSVVDFSDVDNPVVTDVFTNLPRSQKDHLSNSISYGPSGDGGDPWMYFLQGSNQAAGDVDGAWGTRGETQLTAALLRFDPQDALAQARADGPINVATEEVGGSYDPFADDAPLEIYASGIRNAYDLLWHSNGHMYVPTNGTAGGANSPGVTVNGSTMTMTTTQAKGQNGYGNGTNVTEQCATRRIDGQPYTGGSVPAVTNHPTQRDFLFDVEEGGYYGHPNPTRCEWVLNNAGNAEGAGSGGTKYAASVDPDPNFRGWAYDFEFNKSPNGVIEYTSNTFDGALEGRMMVIRFSGNDDVLTMQVADDGTVLGAQPGTDIPGFTGYVDPLDVTEDTSVNPGNLYVNQYNRGGEPQELYLLRVPTDQTAATISVDPAKAVLSATINNEQPTDTTKLTVTNTGSAAVAVTAGVEGTHAGQFSVEAPGTLAAGATKDLTVTFDPTGTPGVRTASVVLTAEGGGSKTVSLRALAFQGQEGNEEPSLQLVFDTLEHDLSTGWSGLAGGTDPAAKGDEVLEPLFQRAGDGPVTMTPIAAFAPQENLPFGWYAAAEGAVTTNQVGSIANGQLQTLNPTLGSGGTSFDPGEESFGLYYDSNTFKRIGYTEDARNDSGGLHRARVYPLPGDRFIVAFEDASNGDYQDYVFLVDNVIASGEVVEPPPEAGDPVKVNFQTETAAVPDGYLRDFGQAFGPRSGAAQGTDLTYGWVDNESLEPLALTANGRDRNLNSDQRLDTLMHMDLPPGSQGGVELDGSWQLAVPEGTYEVTASVGDASRGSAPETHVLNVEGVDLVTGFPNSTAPNGSAGRHQQKTVTVEVLDGELTVDQTGGTNTKINYIEVTPLDGGPVTQTVAQVNFQPAAATTPAEWVADTGALFTADRGYGWVRTEGGAAKTADTRNRTSETNPLTATTILVDDDKVPSITDGEWEYALPDGDYTVEVSVGDPDYADSVHGITAEGVSVIDNFVPTGLKSYGTDSVTVEVEDGALTLASSGSNTKLQWVTITSSAEGDIVPPQVAVGLDGEGSEGSYTGPVTVTVTATDRTLEFVDYSLDGAPAVNYTKPFEVTAAGNHKVVVTAVDGAGNETVRTVEFTIVELGDGDLTMTNAEAAPFNDRLVMSRIQSTNSNPANADTATVTLGNNGTEPLEVAALDISAPGDFQLVNAPQLPVTIPVGGQLPVTVKFIGVGSGANTNFESALVVRHDGSDGPASIVELGAIWQSQSEGGREPDVTNIVQAYGLGTTILGPGDKLNNQGRLETIGDEVLSKAWKRSDTSKPITVRQLAAYHSCCTNTAAFGWHPVGNKNSWTRPLVHAGQWAQTLRPRINGSATAPAVATFTPGPATFSWRIDPESSDWTLNNSTPDSCGSGNEGCQLGHHLRTFPVKDRDGAVVPGSYLVMMDYAGINYDYNDNVYLVTNVAPADN